MCSSSTIATAYSEFVSDNNLVHHIAEPSRVTTTSATLINHILTTPNIVVDSMCQSVDLSDHLVQILDASLALFRFSYFVSVIGVLLGILLHPLLGKLWMFWMMLMTCGTTLRPLYSVYLMNMLLSNQLRLQNC